MSRGETGGVRLRDELARFVELRWPRAGVVQLAGDASTRRFYRVRRPGGGSVVLMDYGCPFAGETDNIRLHRVFARAGLPVADLLEAAPEAGCLVLEDLGDRSLEDELASAVVGGAPPAALARAVDLAAAVAERGTPALAASERAAGPALDAARFRFEMDFFLEHFARGLRGISAASPSLRAELHRLADLAAATPRSVFCHRDFHSRNLMLRGDGALVMIDIQDARWGPDTYDLASILRDAYVAVEEVWVEPLIGRYLAELDDPPEPNGFRARFHSVAVQRMLKALGSFGYLTEEGHGRDYRKAIPPTLERLRRWMPRREETSRLHDLLEREGLLSC